MSKIWALTVLLFLYISVLRVNTEGEKNTELLLVTVATNETDGLQRLVQTARHHKIKTKVLGKDEPWDGGRMTGIGGGQKVNILRRGLKKIIEKHSNPIVLFTDGYDVIIAEEPQKILEKFHALKARIVFSAEVFCWPSKSLAELYPPTESPYKYLNSGGFVGYAKDIYELIKTEPITDRGDDQLYYSKLYLNRSLREKYNLKLDSEAAIFQNLNGAQGDLKLEIEGDNYVLINAKSGTKPSVIHGNGLSKLTLNSLGNYLSGAWSSNRGCVSCVRHEKNEIERSYPVITIALFITQKTPFIKEFFTKIGRLDYPKNKLHLFVYNRAEYHEKDASEFVEEFRSEYLSTKETKPSDEISQAEGRNLAVDHCLAKNCKYLFSVDSTAHLDNPMVLSYLIEDQKNVVGPLLVRPYKSWSNFWGDLNADGYYARSFDYMDIVDNKKRGLWNVPFVGECYLINASVLPQIRTAFSDPYIDPDMAFCNNLRNNGIFMFVDNLVDMGHLVDAENFASDGLVNPEFYQLSENQWDWERRYIHEDYVESLRPEAVHREPCPDVYWFPIVTPDFCRELVEIMENFGEWSTGTNDDERLAGGYENVPTRDIHMNQVGLEPMWLRFLHLYVRPLQEAVFSGYYHDPPRSLMNFVVRYRPDEQPSLRPHHDSSTYTINIALNTPDVDYQGGGCRFIRYNCSVKSTKTGWMLMHPGRLTHYHEGLPVTNGTRYIMISFVDP